MIVVIKSNPVSNLFYFQKIDDSAPSILTALLGFCTHVLHIFINLVGILNSFIHSYSISPLKRWDFEFKYLGTTLTNRNSIQEEIKSRLKSGNACYHSVQNLLSSVCYPKIQRLIICGILILPVVLYGCETGSLTLREGHRLRVFDNRALRRIFGPKRDEVTGEWRKLHNEELNDPYS